jgi:AcrR family transcriptional regulator
MATNGAASRARPGRVALLRTAVELMSERGYGGTSTRDIASACGVSVAALYYHFPSKLALLREFLHDAHDVVLARLERAVAAAGPGARDRLDAAVHALVWSSLHDEFAMRATRVAWREHGRLQEPDQRAIAEKRERMVAVIEQVIAEGVAAGEFTTTDPPAVARAVLTLCIAVGDPFPELAAGLDEVIEQHQRFAAALADAPGPASTTGQARSRTAAR